MKIKKFLHDVNCFRNFLVSSLFVRSWIRREPPADAGCTFQKKILKKKQKTITTMKSITVALFLVAIVSVFATESDWIFNNKEKKLKEGPSQEFIGWLLKEKQAVLTEDLSKDFGPMTTRNISRFFMPNINAIKDKFHNKKTWDQGYLSFFLLNICS